MHARTKPFRANIVIVEYMGWRIAIWAVLCALSMPGADRPPTFAFADFETAEGLRLVPSAQRSGKVLRLTPALQETAGAAWFAEKQPVGNGFETSFEFRITDQGGLSPGADGFAFVLQNSGPGAVAGRGAAGGFALGDGYGNRNSPGIPSSVAVFFDTFKNHDAGDPSANYIAICTNGRPRDMRWPPPRLAYTHKLKVKLKDGRVHFARLVYKPPVISVYLDNPAIPVLTSTLDLSTIVDSDERAYVGFTASTGAGFENHDILSWSFTAGPKPVVSSSISFLNAACLPDRNLCTPDQSTVEETAPGHFHIVLPANLEWGASISNPSERAIAVSNVHGMVCWDFKSRGAEGCSATAGPISKTTGNRTYFSIDGHGTGFSNNEGFIEFDVAIP